MSDITESLLAFIPACILIVAFFAFSIWLIVDSNALIRFDGKIKRGVKVWSKELSYDAWQYLSNLKNDVVEYRQILFSKYQSSFIRVSNGEVVIFTLPRRFHSSWSYVGYVDLTSPGPELEYRASLPGILFLIPFTIFGLIIFVVNFIFQTKAIDSFLDSKTNEYIRAKGISSLL